MMTGSTTSFVFDSEDLDQRDRFDAYRQLYAGGSTVEPTDRPFRAKVEAQYLGKVVMFERRLGGLSHERSAQRVRRDGFEHFTLQLNLSGGLHADTAEGTYRVPPGGIVLFDLTRPQRTRLEDTHFLTFSVARDIVEAANPNASALHGQVLSSARAGLLADLMVSFVRRRVAEDPESLSNALQMFQQAMTLALNQDCIPSPVDSGGALQRVKLLIESNLAQRELSPSWLAAASGLSRSRLYELFKPIGGISRYVQKSRASRLKALLSHPSTQRISIGALALEAGFISESHAIRTFSKQFGRSPGEYRRTLDQIGREAHLVQARGFTDWIRALN